MDTFYGTATQEYGGLVELPTQQLQMLASFVGAPPGILSGDRSDQAWMPSGRLQYQITPDAMVYFTYAKGFKAGGFNGGDTTGVSC